MPELPEVENVVRAIRPLVLGAVLHEILVRQPKLRVIVPVEELKAVCRENPRVKSVYRRGKFILLETDGATIYVHLGMSGTLTFKPEKMDHLHVEFLFDKGKLIYRDPRRFGSIGIWNDKLESSTGPEPLEHSNLAGYLKELATRYRRRPLKSLLMDSQKIAGIGNIYASEIMFRARLHPQAQIGTIAHWQRMADSICFVLNDAIVEGGTSIRDFSGPSGHDGEYAKKLAVYQRAGQPCPRCKRGRIQKITQAGRSTFFCSGCQK